MLHQFCVSLKAAGLVAMLVSAPLSFATDTNSPCGDIPSAPTMIDGATAKISDVIGISKSVREFVKAANTFINCTNQQGGGAIGQEQVAALRLQKNNINEELNTQIDAFELARSQ